MREDDGIREIVDHLHRLNIQQAELIERLERLSTERRGTGNTTVTHVARVPTRTATELGTPTSAARISPRTATESNTIRDFAIGDRVRVLNPRRLQPHTGRVVRIGSNRITIQTSLGTKIVRAPENLILQ
jgi:hypothetical protein